MSTISFCERAAVASMGSLFAALALACQPSAAPAPLEDTPENRAAQVDRYFVAQPPEQMLADMVENMSARMPDEQRTPFVSLMTKHLDMAKLNTAMRESMGKHFTADELRALADFYGSELGKSAMQKFGTYMADVMPTIQAEIMAAVGKAQSEFTQQQQPQPPTEAAPEAPKEAPAEPPKG
jgi:hypothetical protein